MLTYETPAGTAEIENRWDELTPDLFIKTVALTNRFFAGGFNIDEYRLQLLGILTGYIRKTKKGKGKKENEIDIINENLFLISEQLTFPIHPKCGPEEVLEFFSPELRKLLETRFPWEVYDPEMVSQLNMMAKRLKIEYDLNFNLGKNPIPFIRIGETLLKGPVFNTADGDLDTDLKAGMYLDAQEYFTAYAETGKAKYLDLLIHALYVEEPASTASRSASINMETVPEIVEGKDAILLVFIYIQQTLVNDPIFSILFSHDSAGSAIGAADKLSLGPDEAIAQLVEAGYGSHESILNLDIRTFFNFQIMMIKKNVAMMRSYDKNPGEIARELGLPVETIQKL